MEIFSWCMWKTPAQLMQKHGELVPAQACESWPIRADRTFRSSPWLLDSMKHLWIFPRLSCSKKTELARFRLHCDAIDWCGFYSICKLSHSCIIHVHHQSQPSCNTQGFPFQFSGFLYIVLYGPIILESVQDVSFPPPEFGWQINVRRIVCASWEPCLLYHRVQTLTASCTERCFLHETNKIKSRESVAYESMFEVSPWQDTQTIKPRLSCI